LTTGDGRAWFLRIVRNTCYAWRGHASPAPTDQFDEELHSGDHPRSDPEALLLQTDDVTLIQKAMQTLPARFRELLVLRELQGLSYRELAGEMSTPIGTVMSGLSRARRALRGALDEELKRCGRSWETHSRNRRQPR
jgi:RNA polymerase sigma-70 factor (ECF subfamily)